MWIECFGGHSGGETPGHIPNPEAKPSSADGTAPARVWESRTPPNTHHTFEGRVTRPSNCFERLVSPLHRGAHVQQHVGGLVHAPAGEHRDRDAAVVGPAAHRDRVRVDPGGTAAQDSAERTGR